MRVWWRPAGSRPGFLPIGRRNMSCGNYEEITHEKEDPRTVCSSMRLELGNSTCGSFGVHAYAARWRHTNEIARLARATKSPAVELLLHFRTAEVSHFLCPEGRGKDLQEGLFFKRSIIRESLRASASRMRPNASSPER
jgi:hypothetical protein